MKPIKYYWTNMTGAGTAQEPRREEHQQKLNNKESMSKQALKSHKKVVLQLQQCLMRLNNAKYPAAINSQALFVRVLNE